MLIKVPICLLAHHLGKTINYHIPGALFISSTQVMEPLALIFQKSVSCLHLILIDNLQKLLFSKYLKSFVYYIHWKLTRGLSCNVFSWCVFHNGIYLFFYLSCLLLREHFLFNGTYFIKIPPKPQLLYF